MNSGDENLTEITIDDNSIANDDFEDDDIPDYEDNVEEVVGDEENENKDEEDNDMDYEDNIGLDPSKIIDKSIFQFNKHTDSVYSISIHPINNNILLTGGGDDKAYLFQYDISSSNNNKNNSLISCYEFIHNDTVCSVGFNFDGTLALTGGYDGQVKIWEVNTGTLKQTLEGPEDIEWAQWHNKGNAVIAGSRDGTIWMWMAHDGTCMQVFAGHEGGVSCGIFTKDGKVICSGGDDGSVRLWAPKSGLCKHVFTGFEAHQATVTSIDSSLDGQTIVTGSIDGKLRYYHVSSKKLLHTFVHSKPEEVPPVVGIGATTSLPPRPPSDGDMETEEQEDGEESVMTVECVGISLGDQRWVASGGMDGQLKVWDVTTGQLRTSNNHGATITALKWHESLPLIVTCSVDAIIRVIDARNGNCLQELTGHTKIVTNLDVKTTNNGDSFMVASVSDDNMARIFNIDVRSIMTA